MKSSCGMDDLEQNKANCYCDTEMCNTNVMLNVGDYSNGDESSTTATTTYVIENVATKKDVLLIPIVLIVLSWVILIYFF